MVPRWRNTRRKSGAPDGPLVAGEMVGVHALALKHNELALDRLLATGAGDARPLVLLLLLLLRARLAVRLLLVLDKRPARQALTAVCACE